MLKSSLFWQGSILKNSLQGLQKYAQIKDHAGLVAIAAVCEPYTLLETFQTHHLAAILRADEMSLDS